MREFKDIYLSSDEKKSLRSFRWHPIQLETEIKCFETLYYDYVFLRANFSTELDEFNAPIKDGTYSLNTQYERYKVYLRRQRLHDLPNWIAITISLVSLVANIAITIWLR